LIKAVTSLQRLGALSPDPSVLAPLLLLLCRVRFYILLLRKITKVTNSKCSTFASTARLFFSLNTAVFVGGSAKHCKYHDNVVIKCYSDCVACHTLQASKILLTFLVNIHYIYCRMVFTWYLINR